MKHAAYALTAWILLGTGTVQAQTAASDLLKEGYEVKAATGDINDARVLIIVLQKRDNVMICYVQKSTGNATKCVQFN